MTPRASIPQRVVHVGSGRDVTFVMVDGDVLLRDRAFDDYDVAGILEDANRAFEAAIERIDGETHLTEHPNTWGGTRY
jgi:cytosine/adenosine deaminase-related metal-dependent hydrolase